MRPEALPPAGPVRVAVVGTPRSGNTWLSILLAHAYQVPRHAYHLDSLDWVAVPPECVIQVHLPATKAWCDELAAHGFRQVVIARHPLDVLVSILHFARYAPEVLRWLGGSGGGEESIIGAAPGDRRFVDYATGPRAAALLGVSTFWWETPGAVGTRYESLVADPLGELRRVLAAAGVEPRSPDLAADVAAALPDLRGRSPNQHFWQGRPGLWRDLLVAADARAIAAAHPAAFRTFGYDCDPDPGLTADQAARHWTKLTMPAWHDNAQRLWAQQERDQEAARVMADWQKRTRVAEEAYARADAECHRLQEGWARADAECHRLQEGWARADAECHRLRAALAEFEALGPFAWSVARRVKRFNLSHPRLVRLGRWMVR